MDNNGERNIPYPITMETLHRIIRQKTGQIAQLEAENADLMEYVTHLTTQNTSLNSELDELHNIEANPEEIWPQEETC